MKKNLKIKTTTDVVDFVKNNNLNKFIVKIHKKSGGLLQYLLFVINDIYIEEGITIENLPITNKHPDHVVEYEVFYD